MEFRTIVEITEQKPDITYFNKIMMFGSCFAENIGKKLEENKFQIQINPFGILYNPESIQISIDRIISKQLFSEQEIFEQNGIWNSFYHHSRFSENSSAQFLSNANKQLEIANSFFQETDFLIITFGTSWVYKLKESGKVVSNCHKLPNSLFIREKLMPESISLSYTELINSILKIRPEIKIIFTVSPIRHWKDGAHENQLSKATLLLAIDRLKSKYPENIIYFPAYEIVLDDLRDYRFYEDDMIHPNETAIRYIWQQFSTCFFSETTVKQRQEFEKIISATKHRPFNKQSHAYMDFLNKNLEILFAIEKNYPYLDFSKEKNYFETTKRNIFSE